METKRKIVLAAIDIIAERGLVGLTHRLVAERAGVRLAATTYYYETKYDIVADVSNALLNTYAGAFERVATRIKNSAKPAPSFQGFVYRLLRNVVKKNNPAAVAWMEILLDTVRHPENMHFMRQWEVRLKELWVNIAVLHDVADPENVARSAVDLVIGVQLTVLALGLDEEAVTAVLVGGKNPFELWAPRHEQAAIVNDDRSHRGTDKARATRARIMDATLKILVEDGAAAISYRLVAQQAGLTSAAPGYHFSTPSALLREAQKVLFDKCNGRYRAAMSGLDHKTLDVERLVDLTGAVLLREATEFGAQNLASFGIWLEAARVPELRPLVWNAIADQGQTWRRVLSDLQADVMPGDALLAQCMFTGKLIRITCLGASTADLAQVRQEFLRDIDALVDHQHWASIKNSTVQ